MYIELFRELSFTQATDCPNSAKVIKWGKRESFPQMVLDNKILIWKDTQNSTPMVKAI